MREILNHGLVVVRFNKTGLNNQAWLLALADIGLKQDRRALRVLAHEMTWQWLDDDSIQIRFTLRPGSYATMVIRESAKV